MLNSNFLAGYLSQTENIEDLPTQSDVVIIGGGLLGTALSYYLAKAGVEVALLERNDLNREASGTNAGSFHFQIALHQLTENMTAADDKRLADETKLMLDAASLWDDIEKELDADLGVHFTG
jgi:glycine/D-amino acid oxidase-like deaminating enzyme